MGDVPDYVDGGGNIGPARVQGERDHEERRVCQEVGAGGEIEIEEKVENAMKADCTL